jgi:hypothetical protein
MRVLLSNLVVVHISDHIARVCEKSAVGALCGKVSDGQVSLLTYLESIAPLDVDKIGNDLELHQSVFADHRVLGWYKASALDLSADAELGSVIGKAFDISPVVICFQSPEDIRVFRLEKDGSFSKCKFEVVFDEAGRIVNDFVSEKILLSSGPSEELIRKSIAFLV